MQLSWAQKPPADIRRVGQILNLVVTIKQDYSFKQHQYQLSSSFILLLNRLHERVSCFPPVSSLYGNAAGLSNKNNNEQLKID